MPALGHDAFERALSHGDVIACCVPDSNYVFRDRVRSLTMTMLSYEDGRFLILIDLSQGSVVAGWVLRDRRRSRYAGADGMAVPDYCFESLEPEPAGVSACSE